MRWIKHSAVCLLTVCVGCTSTGHKSPLPTDGQKMLDIYRNHTGNPSWHEVKPNNQRQTQRPSQTKNRSARSANGGAQAFDGTGAGKTETTQWRVVPFESSILNQVTGERTPPEFSLPTVQQSKTPIGHTLYGDYTRQSANEIQVLFPRLPNPDISIFIYPHLATVNNVPIPGYTTVIPLYEQVEYALPGEQAMLSSGRRYGYVQ